ncbi:MAG: hypothetical protein QF464_09625, partial [Myxococcota bacterium]|nr:hypothetical protein [Myxococcota bacterium]
MKALGRWIRQRRWQIVAVALTVGLVGQTTMQVVRLEYGLSSVVTFLCLWALGCQSVYALVSLVLRMSGRHSRPAVLRTRLVIGSLFFSVILGEFYLRYVVREHQTYLEANGDSRWVSERKAPVRKRDNDPDGNLWLHVGRPNSSSAFGHMEFS